jgi:two-component system, cell cycle response regulator DivK
LKFRQTFTPNWEGKTILLVDDETSCHILVGKYLERTKARLLSARNGEEGVDFYLGNQMAIDLIIMDINMPVMDGIEAIRQIRKTDKRVPIIVQTALFSSEKRVAFESGCTDYISKPVSDRELLITIQKYFS